MVKVKYILFIISICTASPTFCQKLKQVSLPPSSEPKYIGGTKFNLQKRLSFYPFNKATQIKLVSFTERIDSSTKNPDEKIIWGLPKINDTICFSLLEEVKTINLRQIDTLTDVLYNTIYRWNITIATTGLCYYPRNAIIFFDEDGKPFEYIEICFECNNIKYSSKEIIRAGVFDHMYENLQKFFKNLGIKTTEQEFLNKK